eukprot:195980-Hanusia_phi.AAC.2
MLQRAQLPQLHLGLCDDDDEIRGAQIQALLVVTPAPSPQFTIIRAHETCLASHAAQTDSP